MPEEGLGAIAKWQNLLNVIKERKMWIVKIANILKGHAKGEDLEERQ